MLLPSSSPPRTSAGGRPRDVRILPKPILPLLVAGALSALVAPSPTAPARPADHERAMRAGSRGVAGVLDAGARDTVTWAEDAAPVFFQECVQCHRAGGPAPFSLRSYEPAARHADLIAERTSTRFMPPWLPEPGYVEYAGERRLTEPQIRTLRQWAAGGAPPGDTASVEPPPLPPEGWQLGEPDLVIEMDRPFRVPGGGSDIFRNFLIPIPVDGPRWVRGVELRPGNPRVVHHAIMMIDTTESSRLAAARDSGPGFEGMIMPGRAHPPGGFLPGWTPGRVPAFASEGLAWRLVPGTDMVLQLHLRPTPTERSVQARIGLHFTEEAPERVPYTVMLTSQVQDIPAGDRAYTVQDSFRLPVDVEALSVYPHAHYLGKRIHAWASLPDGSRKWLVRIDDWDFNWQDAYRFAEPISLPAGTELRARITYDNSASNPQNPHDPPRRVTYGMRSTDEMGDVYLQVVVADSAALRPLRTAYHRKDLRSKAAGWRATLERDPGNPEANHFLGLYLQSGGQVQAAILRYRRALEGRPGYVAAHYNLATALQVQGDGQGAVRHYRAAVDLDPGHADAHNNLGSLLAARGRPEEALRHFRTAVEAAPHHAGAHSNLGNLLRTTGRPEEALSHLRRALELRPGYVAAAFNLALLHRAAGRTDSAVTHLRRVVARRPERSEPYLTLAWSLATSPDTSLRAPSEAVAAARRGVELAARDPRAHMVLGAAYASAGRFQEAVDAVEEGLQLARRTGDRELARSLERLRELFRNGRPYVTSG